MYYAPTFAGTLFVTQEGELVYALSGRTPLDQRGRPSRRASREPGWSLTETFQDGQARPEGSERSATTVSSFVGDSQRWRPSLTTYDSLRLGEVWPGVSVALRAHAKNVEKVFTVEPGAPVSRIRVRVGGAEALSVDGAGALVATTGRGRVTFTTPIAYQEREGLRQAVSVGYRLDGPEYGFDVGAYDPTLPLIIDPLLQSTFLGGAGDEIVSALAIHPTTGKVYVAGATTSLIFPQTVAGGQSVKNLGYDAFVTRLDSTLTLIEQSTFLGDDGDDFGDALAFDPVTGDVYLAGDTDSSTLPGVGAGSAQTLPGGGPSDAFITRFPSSLQAITRTTFLGGNDEDVPFVIVRHPLNNDLYVAGTTDSPAFPPPTAGAFQETSGGSTDGFITRLPLDLGSFTMTTFVGGTAFDQVFGLAIHPTSGNVYVVGVTESYDFPSTAGGAQTAFAGGSGFAAVFTANLDVLNQATYFGGLDDLVSNVAIRPGVGDVYIAGVTSAVTLPGTAGPSSRLARAGSTPSSRTSMPPSPR